MIKLLYSCLAFLVFSINLLAQDSQAIEDIKERAKMFSQYFVEGNTEALVGMYMDDAKIFPSDLDILDGKDSIMAYWKPNPDCSSAP